MSKKRFKQILLLVALGVLLLFLKDNIKYVFDAIGLVLIVAMPFIIGFCIAFLINKPYVFSRKRCSKNLVTVNFKWFAKYASLWHSLLHTY